MIDTEGLDKRMLVLFLLLEMDGKDIREMVYLV